MCGRFCAESTTLWESYSRAAFCLEAGLSHTAYHGLARPGICGGSRRKCLNGHDVRRTYVFRLICQFSCSTIMQPRCMHSPLSFLAENCHVLTFLEPMRLQRNKIFSSKLPRVRLGQGRRVWSSENWRT